MKKIKFFVCWIYVGIMVLGVGMESSANEIVVWKEQSKVESVIAPRAETIVWVFKEINGKIYRRLYNRTTGEYIGDWILCE